MLSTSVRHGDLVIDFDSNGEAQITRQSNAMAIRLSKSEFIFLTKVMELKGWPVAPPRGSIPSAEQDYDKPNQHIE